jgi:hypothetical protein
MKPLDIKRQKVGRTPTIHGIVSGRLRLRHRYILKANRYIVNHSNDDAFLNIILRMEDTENIEYRRGKFVIDPNTGNIYTLREFREVVRYHDWNCAYCKKKISCRIDSFEEKDFVCDGCFKYYVKDSSIVNETIIDSSLNFAQHCKNILREEQKTFLKYAKRNASR